MCPIYLFLFALFVELGSPIQPDDFQDLEVKDELLESDIVSCAYMQTSDGSVVSFQKTAVVLKLITAVAVIA